MRKIGEGVCNEAFKSINALVIDAINIISSPNNLCCVEIIVRCVVIYVGA